MIEEFSTIRGLFMEIDSKLESRMAVYVIGGAVLLYQGIEPGTQDVDLVVKDADDYDSFKETLQILDFKPKKPDAGYHRMGLDQIMARKDFRIDLFNRIVCGKFSLSENMIKRAVKILPLKNLEVHNCSNEDIFAFKTMTERPGDIDDCIALAKRGLDWDIILKEIQEQIRRSGQDIWITWINERLELLEEKKVNVPIIKKTSELTKEYYKMLEKSQP